MKMGRIGYRPPWVRHLSLGVRAFHLLGGAVILATFLLPASVGPPLFYLWMTLGSGALLMAGDWMQHRQLARELTGVVTLAKVVVFGAAYHGFLPTREVVVLVFIAATITAHAPKKVRHRLLF